MSTLRDAAKQVRDLADRLAPIIYEDAALIGVDIELQWCRYRLADEDRTESRVAGIREQLAIALDRVARTGAKTPRGNEIKFAA